MAKRWNKLFHPSCVAGLSQAEVADLRLVIFSGLWFIKYTHIDYEVLETPRHHHQKCVMFHSALSVGCKGESVVIMGGKGEQG